MTRPRKLPHEEMPNVIGFKVTEDIESRVLAVGQLWNKKKAATGRELMLLGLSFIEALAEKGVYISPLNLTDAFRAQDEPKTPTSTMAKIDLTGNDDAAHSLKADKEHTHRDSHTTIDDEHGENLPEPPPPGTPLYRGEPDLFLTGTAFPSNSQAAQEVRRPKK